MKAGPPIVNIREPEGFAPWREAGAVESVAVEPQRPEGRERAIASLRSALRAGSGHIAVITASAEESIALIEEALDRLRAHAIFRLRAIGEEPLRDADRELGIGGARRASAYERQRALEACIENARAAGLPICAVILDAEAATAEHLEHTRMALECVPVAIGRVRMLVAGAERLAATLMQPAASALASRIGTRIELVTEKLDPVVMQAGTFADRDAAYSLQRSLAEQVREVHVATLEAPRGHLSQGHLYSVRVVGLRTRGEIERAETAIRRLGQDPVRVASDSRRRHHRARDARRAFWARLFGR